MIKQRNHGFTLIELAVVLVIVGILLYTTISVGVAQLEAGKIKATNDKMNKIVDAITVYYRTNMALSPVNTQMALPCPAGPNVTIGTGNTFGTGTRLNDANAAASFTTCTATNVFWDSTTAIYVGVVPVRDLNLPDDYMFDAWGNRITYIVSKNCIDKDNWSATYTYKCYDGTTITANGGKLQIKGLNTTNWPTTAAYALISHGKDTIGAWNRAGTKITGVATNTTTEKNNGNLVAGGTAVVGNTAWLIYYDKAINDGGSPSASAAGNYFDDIVRWKTAPQIYYDASH